MRLQEMERSFGVDTSYSRHLLPEPLRCLPGVLRCEIVVTGGKFGSWACAVSSAALVSCEGLCRPGEACGGEGSAQVNTARERRCVARWPVSLLPPLPLHTDHSPDSMAAAPRLGDGLGMLSM